MLNIININFHCNIISINKQKDKTKKGKAYYCYTGIANEIRGLKLSFLQQL